MLSARYLSDVFCIKQITNMFSKINFDLIYIFLHFSFASNHIFLCFWIRKVLINLRWENEHKFICQSLFAPEMFSINLAQDLVILFVFICAFLLASKNNADDDGLFGNRVIRCVTFLTNKEKYSTKSLQFFLKLVSRYAYGNR